MFEVKVSQGQTVFGFRPQNASVFEGIKVKVKELFSKPVSERLYFYTIEMEVSQTELRKSAELILSNVPPAIRKYLNVEDLMTVVHAVYKTATSKIRKRESALRGFVTSYGIKGIDKMDPKTFLENNKTDVLDFIERKHKTIKMKFLLEVAFYKKRQKG